MTRFLTKPVGTLTALYTLAWAPILFMRGVYWDGWVYFNQYAHPDFAYIWAIEFGPQQQYPHWYLFRLIGMTHDPILTTRILVFLSWLLAGLCIYHILTRALKWDNRHAFLVAAYYLVFPAFLVRFEIIHPLYSLANVLFVVGWTLYFLPPKRFVPRIIAEATSIALFIFAFFVNSYAIFFYAFAAMHFVMLSSGSSFRRAATAYATRYWYLLLLPIAFLTYKFTYLQPYGAASSYNEPVVFHAGMSVVSMLSIFLNSFWSGVYTGIIWPLVRALQYTEMKFFCIALAISVSAVYVLLRNHGTSDDATISIPHTRYSLSTASATFLGGIVLCLIALFPYVAVGKPPHSYGYGFGLRHTLLFPLVNAFILVGGAGALVKMQFQRMTHIVLLSLSIAFIWYNVFLLDIDWYKQQAILHELPALMAQAPEGTVFVFDDQTPGLNWNNRNLSRQEYDGYLQFLSGARNYRGVSAFEFTNSPLPSETSATSTRMITITSAAMDDPRVTDWIRLKYIELLRPARLPEAAESRLRIILTASN